MKYQKNLFGDKIKKQKSINLVEKYIAPPFSVLDTRKGYWQKRKRKWKNIIKDNGETRKNSMANNPESYNKKMIHNGETMKFAPNVSLFDPVLAEIINKWYNIPQGKTFDPFAGDTVFGFVSAYMGNHFTGIEIRQEQVNINQKRVNTYNLDANYICDDGQNARKYIDDYSQDLLFSCPPYYNLEKYSDLEKDASNQETYKDFINIIDNVFSEAIKCLNNNRFAVIVVGDIRDKDGFYYNFPSDIKNIFINNGMRLYNEHILVEAIGTGAMRANSYMINRKVVKTHQQVLVFYKGNPNKISKIYYKLGRDPFEL